MAWDIKKAIIYSHFAYSFPTTVFGFALIGFLIDKKFSTFYKFTVTGFVLGIVSGIFNVIRTLLKEEEKE